MMRASIPRPLAEKIAEEMHDTAVRHYDGWHQGIAEGWTLRRAGPQYILQHGRGRIGTVQAVRLTDTHLEVELTNGLTCAYVIRRPRGGRVSDYSPPTHRQAVERAVRTMDGPFTARQLADSIPYRNGPTSLQVANILARSDLATCRRGVWYPREVR